MDKADLGFGSAPSSDPLAALDAQAMDFNQLTTGLGGPNVVSSLGPGIPIVPMHPEEVEPRRYDYPVGFNVVTKPRAYEPITFETLIALARNYDIAALAREKRIDDFRRLEWAIRPRKVEGEKRADRLARQARLSDAVNAVQGFFESPDQEHQWGSWIYAYLDQLFVTDAPTLYLRYTKGGDLYALEVVDGSTILPLIDLWGRLPAPPMAAYRQIIKGMPWTFQERLVAANNVTSWSTNQMSYDPYWAYAGSPYGHPPMERVLLAVNRALRRQTLDMSMYTEGSVPKGALYQTPQGWGSTQIAEIQKMFDSMIGGNDAERSKLRFVPGGQGAGFLQVNPEPSNDVEQWLMQVTAGAHGVSPMELGFTLKSSGLGGKGFAEEQAKSSNERNVALVKHVEGIFNKIIGGPLKQPELEFVFPEVEEVEDAKAQAERVKTYWDIGVMSSDYIAEDILDIDPPGLGPTILNGTAGVVPVSAIAGGGGGTAGLIPGTPAPPSDPTNIDAGTPSTEVSSPSAMPGATQAGEPALKVKMDKLVLRSLERQYPPELLTWVKTALWRYEAHVLLADIDMARRPGGRDPSNTNRIEGDIEATGQVVPIVLVQTPAGLPYKIADGWHRTLAAKHAGQEFIPAYIGQVAETSGPWDRQMQELQYRKAVLSELAKWQRKSLAALSRGRSAAVRFESALDLPAVDLSKAATADEVKAVFEKAGASADPLVALRLPSGPSYRNEPSNRHRYFRGY